ncbi:MAG: hypothetical protein AB7F74_29265, partial [Parvibaculaceae bacterium]
MKFQRFFTKATTGAYGAIAFADGSCRHSYAAVALKPSQLRVHALLARKVYGRGWTECLARL